MWYIAMDIQLITQILKGYLTVTKATVKLSQC